MKTKPRLIDSFFVQMYGRYSKDLGEYAKSEARKLRMLERRRKKEDKERNRVRYTRFNLIELTDLAGPFAFQLTSELLRSLSGAIWQEL